MTIWMDAEMGKKRHKPEEIVAKLRQVEVLTAQGKSTFEGLRDRRGLDEAFRSDVFRHEIGMLAKAITRSLNLDHGGMKEDAVKQGGRDDGVSKNMSPFGKSAI